MTKILFLKDWRSIEHVKPIANQPLVQRMIFRGREDSYTIANLDEQWFTHNSGIIAINNPLKCA
jgi:hypothetical protein